MRCQISPEELSRYSDGSLVPERSRRLEIHISGCGECRRTVWEFRRMADAIRAIPFEHISPAFTARILTQTDRPVHATLWGAAGRTLGAIVMTAICGFRVDQERENALRHELPGWVSRWVMFV